MQSGVIQQLQVRQQVHSDLAAERHAAVAVFSEMALSFNDDITARQKGPFSL